MLDQDPGAVEQPVGRLGRGHVDLDQLAADLHAEAQAIPGGREAGAEAHVAVGVAQAAEAGHEREPGAAAGGDVDAVRGVAVEVGQVDRAGVEEVLERRVGVADLGRR